MLAFQQDNFVTPPYWVGLDNFRHLFSDPLFATAWKNTAEFTGLALLLGYAVPFVVAVRPQRAAAPARLLPDRGLPAGDPAADRHRAALAVLLRPRQRPVQPAAVRRRPADVAVAAEPADGDAVAGPGVHLGQHGRRHDPLPGRPGRHPGRPVRGGRARRRRGLAPDLARDPAADAVPAARPAAAADHRDHAGVHRALPAHRHHRPEHHHDHRAHLPVRLRGEPGLRSRGRDERAAVRRAGRLLRDLPAADPVRRLTAGTTEPDERRPCDHTDPDRRAHRRRPPRPAPAGHPHPVLRLRPAPPGPDRLLDRRGRHAAVRGRLHRPAATRWCSGALKTPQELAAPTQSLFPHDWQSGRLPDAWDRLDVGRFLLYTGYYALGAWLFQLAVAVTAAYALSKLRPLLGNVGARADAGHPDGAGRGRAGADVPDRDRRAAAARQPAQHALGPVAAGGGQRVQHLHPQAVLRPDPGRAAGGGRDRRRRQHPDAVERRAAAGPAGARGGLDLHRGRRPGRTSCGRCWCCRTRSGRRSTSPSAGCRSPPPAGSPSR